MNQFLKRVNGKALGLGISFFVMFWLSFDNLALGIALGVAMGAAFSTLPRNKAGDSDDPD